MRMRSSDIKSVWLTLNRSCNLRCKWCYAQESEFKKELNMEYLCARDLINICIKLGIKNFILIGGELTIYESFFDVVRQIIEAGGRITVMTNGLALKSKLFCERIKQIAGDKCQFNISLKGMSDEEYGKNCGVQAFSDVLEGCGNSEKYGIRISFIYIISADNVDRIVEFSQRYKAYGLNKYPLNFSYCNDVINDSSFHNTGCNCKSAVEIDRIFNSHYEEVYEILGSVFGLHQSLPICMTDKYYFDLMKKRDQLFTACHVLRRTGVIFDTNGGLLLCNHLVGYEIGRYGVDYFDMDSFKSFFESDLVNNVRERLTSMPSISCRNCKNASICGGGCCIRWFSQDFSAMKKDALKRKEVIK